jgi:hypothetical protein
MMLARNVRLPEAEFGISRTPKAYKNPPASLRKRCGRDLAQEPVGL